MKITVQIIFIIFMLILTLGTIGETNIRDKRTFLAGAIGFGFLLLVSFKYFG